MDKTLLDRDIFPRIAESIAGKLGYDFLHTLVDVLGGLLSVALVLVTVRDETRPAGARAIFALSNGRETDDLAYDLEGTPCHLVYQGTDLCIPCDLAARFPREAGFEGYLGLPLRDIAGGVLGHLAIFSDREIADPEQSLGLLRIFALRAEAELRRMAQEREREALVARLTELSNRLQVTYGRARKENAYKTRLMGMIAHDLRNPLTVVMVQSDLGRGQLAEIPDRAPAILKRFERIMAAADRMSDQIDATLRRVREDEAGLAPEFRPVDLVVLARIAFEANRPEAEAKDIALAFHEDGPVRATGDEAMLVPAIDNLISNAIKYTHPGGAVELSVRQAGGTAEIEVADTGQGLTEADLGRVFGRFQTLSAKPTGGESSIGLGLANVREIAEAHHGSASAESPGAGLGSRFRISLPLAGAPSGL